MKEKGQQGEERQRKRVCFSVKEMGKIAEFLAKP